MLSSISIAGLGPHEDTTLTLSPSGWTHVEGSSEAGKSVIIDAICFALTGEDAEGSALGADLIHDNAKRAEVVLTTAKGTAIGRTKSRSGAIARTVDGATYTTEAAFAERMGPVGRAVAGKPLARLIAAPLSWVALAQGEGGGRPLRDLIVGLLPGDGSEIVGQLMAAAGHKLEPSDPTTPKLAEDFRRNKNAHADQARGALAQAKGALAAMGEAPAKPSDKDVQAARSLVLEASAWDAYDRARIDHDRAVERRSNAAGALASWEQRVKLRGPRPDPVDVEALKVDADNANLAKVDADAALRALEVALADRLNDITERYRGLRSRAYALDDTAAELRAQPGTCPHCSQAWPGAEDALREAEVELTEAQLALEAFDADAARAQAIEDASPAIEAAKDAARKAGSADLEAHEALRLARQAVDAVARWDRETAADPRPVVPAIAEAPQEPGYPRTDVAAVQKARALLSSLDTQAGAAEQHARQATKLREAVTVAEGKLATAEAEAARAAALVEAFRRAPGARFEQAVAALGDLGPVSLHLPEDERKAIEVRIDGRPWRRASEGRLVYADACFRHALRRAAKASYLPLVIDRMGAWSGDLPPIPGPVIALHTTTGAIRVREA